jgi:phosphopantothenoylcysteine decarboxylase
MVTGITPLCRKSTSLIHSSSLQPKACSQTKYAAVPSLSTFSMASGVVRQVRAHGSWNSPPCELASQIMAESTARGVLYLIVCASPRAARIGELVGRAQVRGWTVCVISTPQALNFIDRPALEEQTGFPVRSECEQWGITDPLPSPDAMLVCPATFNTVNNWAYGLADTLALALLAEAIGLGLPLVAAPALNSAQAVHPAFDRSVTALREMGVTVLYGPGIYEPGPPGTGGRPYDWELPLETLEAKAARSQRR